MLLDKLAFTENKYEELSVKISDPSIMANQKEWRKLCKEHADLEIIVTAYREYKKVVEDLEANKEMLEEETDKEMKEMLAEEISSLKEQEEELENKIQILLLPKDPNDDKNVFVEIRGGAGGDEAALFAANLFRMYTRYAESQRWSVEMMSSNENDLGGFKEVVFMIKGNGAYSKLKYESGVHRVQRVPDTESSGRIHTSTATVAVLPEVDDVEIEINDKDLRIDVYRSSGNGTSMNKYNINFFIMLEDEYYDENIKNGNYRAQYDKFTLYARLKTLEREFKTLIRPVSKEAIGREIYYTLRYGVRDVLKNKGLIEDCIWEEDQCV